MIASYAIQLYPPRTDHPTRTRSPSPWGLAGHTTGDDDGLEKRILEEHVDAGEFYARLYQRAQYYPAYVLGHQGKLYAVGGEELHLPHVGLLEPQREIFLSGEWASNRWLVNTGDPQLVQTVVNPGVVARWQSRWSPRWPSPQHLFPGPSPNDVYVGVEMVPVFPGCGYTPMRPGMKFTREQHDGMARLAIDLAKRHAWTTPASAVGDPAIAWTAAPRRMPNRLLGHEDLNPMDRPGWDPGALRQRLQDPIAFDWTYVFEQVASGAAITSS